MYGSLIPCKISVTFKIYSTRFSLFSFKRNISFKKKNYLQTLLLVCCEQESIHKFSIFIDSLRQIQSSISSQYFKKTKKKKTERVVNKTAEFLFFILRINTHIYVSKNISLFEPIEQQKLSIMCELLNDVTMITARAYCLTVALL